MNVDEAHRRIRSTLRDELGKHRGRIGRIETRLSRSEGYLRKVCNGSRSISLGLLFETLAALDVEPGEFFGRAFGIRPRPESWLREVAGEAPMPRELLRLALATRRVLRDPAPAGKARPGDVAALVAAVAGCSRKEQRRRLRTARRYRNAPFARAFLTHLDRLSRRDPHSAARLAETVGSDLVPAIPAPPAERLELELAALGVYATACRRRGEVAVAARALALALRCARRRQLDERTAELLRRSAQVLRDHGHLQRALYDLRQAAALCLRLESDDGLGRVLVERAAIEHRLGRTEDQALVAERALEFLPDNGAASVEPRLLAHRYLAAARAELGDHDGARRSIERARRLLDEAPDPDAARALWQRCDAAVEKK